MSRNFRPNEFSVWLASFKERVRFDPRAAVLSADERAAMLGWLRGRSVYPALLKIGDALVLQAERAANERRFHALQRIPDLLSGMPLPEGYLSAARYYRALAERRQGLSYWPAVRAELRELAERGPLFIRSRAMLALGGMAAFTGDRQAEIDYYSEAGRLAASIGGYDLRPIDTVELREAIWKSQEEDHRGALAHLERLAPMARTIGRRQPVLWYFYLNSLAVEAMEIGRLDEAHTIARAIVSSPLSAPFFEWRETYLDILERARSSSRSMVSFSRPVLRIERPKLTPTEQMMKIPARVPSATEKPAAQPSNVLAFRKPAPAFTPSPADMSPRQMILRLMELISTDGLGAADLRRMVIALEKIVNERRKESLPNS